MHTRVATIYRSLCTLAGLSGRWNRRRGWLNQQLVPYLCLRTFDGSARQFDDALQFDADGGHAKRHQAAPQLNDFVIPIKTDHVNLEGHSKSMDAGGRFDPQPPSGVQTTSSEKTKHPLHGRIGQLDTISNSSTPGYIGNSKHNNQSTRPAR